MTNSCVHKNCDYSLSDFTFVRNLSGGAQGQTSIRRGKDGKLYCFKTVTAPPSGTLPEEKFMFNELRSPFLVDLLHCFLVDGLMYLCMEYCEGGSLFELLESNIDLSDEDILFIFVQLAHGLNHLHGKSIIHRDIKPGNIVLTSRTPPYRVKYCDFGVSKQVENTMARTFIGTFQFMAPEVVAIWYGEVPANHHYTPAVDIWSLGVVLYLLKEKRYPFKNPNEILSGNIPISNSLFGEIIRKLMVFDASRRISAEQLVNLPEIKQVYDFIENFDENLFSKYQIWIMKKEIERQSNLIGRLESTVTEQNSKISSQSSEILCLKSTVESQNSKISSQNSEIEQLNSHQEQSKNAFESKISSQNSEISSLKSTVHHQNSKIQQLESKLSQTSLLSSDQSTLIDQFKELLPFISQLQADADEKRRIEDEQRLLEIKRKEEEKARKLAEEKRRIEQQKENEVKTNPIQFICKYPSEIFSRFGNRTKFIRETKGSCLELSNGDCLVRSTRGGFDNSFIAINHPLNGRITLTLSSTRRNGYFASYIGYFNPNNRQDRDCYNHFIGIVPNGGGTCFGTKESNEEVTSKLSPSQSIIISFKNNKVTYSTSYSGWSRTVDCVDGWVFGVVVLFQDESWSIK
ncbi:hypothetical protein RCL1_000322 [Eukaryota sp. TZLM3-RCL]